MGKANKAHYKEMLRMIKYILGMTYLVFRMEFKLEPWILTGTTDMDFAWEYDTKKGKTEYKATLIN